MSLRRLIRDEAGVALLEFALLVMVLLLLVFGAIDFGRALFTSNNLTSAAREGARYGAVLPAPGDHIAEIQQTAMARMSPFGNAPVQASQVVVTCLPNCATTQLQSVQVQINYPFTWLTSLPRPLGQDRSQRLRARAIFRWEGS